MIVIAPDGSVYSPWTPAEARSDKHAVALTHRRSGIYRTLVVGSPTQQAAELQLVADNVVRKFPIERRRADGPITVAVTHVGRHSWGWGRGL